jgi:hypothetical protein
MSCSQAAAMRVVVQPPLVSGVEKPKPGLGDLVQPRLERGEVEIMPGLHHFTEVVARDPGVPVVASAPRSRNSP